MNKFDYFVSGDDIPGIVYHATKHNSLNIPYGSVVTFGELIDCATSEDLDIVTGYPQFHIDPVSHEIRQYFSDYDNDYEIVANSGI